MICEGASCPGSAAQVQGKPRSSLPAMPTLKFGILISEVHIISGHAFMRLLPTSENSDQSEHMV